MKTYLAERDEKNISSPWSVISLYGLGCNIVLQLGDLVKGVNWGQ